MNKKRWTEKEEKTLLSKYANTGNTSLANQLGRSPAAILCHANLLGLSKSSRYMAKLRKELGERRKSKF